MYKLELQKIKHVTGGVKGKDIVNGCKSGFAGATAGALASHNQADFKPGDVLAQVKGTMTGACVTVVTRSPTVGAFVGGAVTAQEKIKMKQERPDPRKMTFGERLDRYNEL